MIADVLSLSSKSTASRGCRRITLGQDDAPEHRKKKSSPDKQRAPPISWTSVRGVWAANLPRHGPVPLGSAIPPEALA
jgi:hypothetical protein